MGRGVHIVLRSLFIVSFGILASSAFSDVYCPTFCECDTWYELQRASCTGRHLYSIHTGVLETTEALDLSNNSISTLNNFELANAGLTRIKYLNLSENSINEVGLDAFGGLVNLAVLDLSKNHLYYLLTNTFTENNDLQVLRLSQNNFAVRVPKLQSSSLKELSVDSCLISHIPSDAFNGLNQLRNLDLSNNMMIQLDSLVVRPMPLLRKLSLEGNPWSCNQMMHELEIFLTRKNVKYNPVCDKKPAPKQFEKIVLLKPPLQPDNNRRLITDKKPAKSTESIKNNASDASKNRNTSCIQLKNTQVNLTSTVNQASAYLFIAIGFLLGSATSMVACYVWLTAKYHCCRGCARSRGNDSQRILLLQNLWQLEDPVTNDANSIETRRRSASMSDVTDVPEAFNLANEPSGMPSKRCLPFRVLLTRVTCNRYPVISEIMPLHVPPNTPLRRAASRST